MKVRYKLDGLILFSESKKFWIRKFKFKSMSRNESCAFSRYNKTNRFNNNEFFSPMTYYLIHKQPARLYSVW